jgi:hypothetical protein
MGANVRGTKAHIMCAPVGYTYAHVCADCVVDMRALMRACVLDRSAWRCPCRVSSSAPVRWTGTHECVPVE